jgi:15-cis-phytoene synthase
MMETGPASVAALAEAGKHCAALAREFARDQWLGSLYAPPKAREALLALAAFDYEIRQARLRARNPTLAALRLSWWRGVIQGEQEAEAAGSPPALALLSAIAVFSLPRGELEAMLDSRLTELSPPPVLDLAGFEVYAGESEGARLRLAAGVCGGGADLDAGAAHTPAGLALALVRMLAEMPTRAGSAPTLFPVDIAQRHGATIRDFDSRRSTEAVLAACAAARGLAREKLAEAERRLELAPSAILPAFVPLGALGLDLDLIERTAAAPFQPAAEASPLRRQWAIWRWARRARHRGP